MDYLLILKILLLCAVSFVLAAQDRQDPTSFDVRHVRWGITEQQVIDQEGKTKIMTEDMLVYDALIGDVNSITIYHFDDGKLSTALTVPSGRATDYEAVYTFKNWHDLLSAKYGEATINYEWKTDRIKSAPRDTQFSWSQLANFVLLGEVSIRADWETDRTLIRETVGLGNVNGVSDIDLRISYLDKSKCHWKGPRDDL